SLTLKGLPNSDDVLTQTSATPWIKEISVKFECLKALHIRGLVVSDQDLELLAKTRGKGLHSLKICECQGFSEKGLVHISQYCNDLTSLCLEYDNMDGDHTGEWLRELALHNTPIESLHFRWLFNDLDDFDVEDLTLVAQKCSNSLVSLKISLKPLNRLRDALSNAIKLQDFDGVIFDKDGDYTSFKFPPSIRCLGVPTWRSYVQMMYVEIWDYELLVRCLDVALLDISNEIFECVGTHLNNLCKFRMFLFKKAGISLTGLPLDNGIRAMLKGCIKLKRLTLSLCDGGLTDVGLGYIGKYGHNLRNLFLSCKGVFIAGLLELSKGCPKLRKLYLDYCRLSEQAVAAFVFDIHSLRYV
ncbi:alpha/beta hydrolase fold protein, partial [Tanacetum coccineum]